MLKPTIHHHLTPSPSGRLERRTWCTGLAMLNGLSRGRGFIMRKARMPCCTRVYESCERREDDEWEC